MNATNPLKSRSRMLLIVGESLLVIIQGENLQRTLLKSNERQGSSPTPISATYENQALAENLLSCQKLEYLPSCQKLESLLNENH